MNRHSFFVLFFLVASHWGRAQEINTYTIVKSFETDWRVHANGKFQSFNPKSEGRPHAIYFSVEANKYPGSFLTCSAEGEFSLFINHQLVKISTEPFRLSLDSLSRKYSTSLQCVIFQNQGIERLITQIVKPTTVDDDPVLTKRKTTHFFDFSIIASLIVLAYFIVLIRTFPRLASNYLNVLRLVSLQEREENLAGSRVSSTANILFYVFGSLLAGLVLVVIFHYGSDTTFPLISIDSVWDGFAQWLKWSAAVLILLFLKLALTFLLSGLFNISEFVPFHFFNFLRMLFFVFGASTLLSLGYFIFNGQNPEFYSYLLYGSAILTFFWVLLIYLKLVNRVPFRFFHLFSYLCVSEIIPMVIIFKILLF